ncbi:MAG: hypothetical protein VYD33_03905 [Bacteroidota bacterium]|nr:hypothetical protein [Bacteroidota bacterium]
MHPHKLRLILRPWTLQIACGSLVVKFQDLSKGNPTSWLWDLGNGKISNLE